MFGKKGDKFTRVATIVALLWIVGYLIAFMIRSIIYLLGV